MLGTERLRRCKGRWCLVLGVQRVLNECLASHAESGAFVIDFVEHGCCARACCPV